MRGKGSAALDPVVEGCGALARGAWDEARGRFSAALLERESAEALEGLGWALWWLDEVDESFTARERAYALYAQAGDRRRAARVAIHLAVDVVDVRGIAVTSGWLERAGSLLHGLPPGPEHAWLELWRGHVRLYVENDVASARAGAARAGTLATSLELPGLVLLARALEGLVLVREGEVGEGMRRLDEATAAALAGEITDLDAVATACCFMVYACEHVRDYDRASQWQRRVEKLSSAWRIREVFAGCRVKHAQLLLWQGRWPEAEVLLEQTMGVLERSRPEASREAAACLGELRRRQGRLAEARDLFARAEGLSIGWVGLAALALGQGDARSAIEHLDRASRRVQPDNLAVRAVILELSLDARLLLDEPEAAREAAGSLLELALLAKTPPLLSAAHVARGRIALAERRLDDAVPAFEDAVDLYAQSGAPYEAACARLLLVEALEGAGRTARGGLEADRARSALAAIGAQEPPRRPPAADAARREVQRSASAGPVPTTRELDVLRLVAEGLPDREIAARLRLSGHTVHRHVANLFTKLECSSRAAAVSKAARLGYL